MAIHTDLASHEFLSSLRALFPSAPSASGVDPTTLWTIVAVVSFSASNAPDAVPSVFTAALADLVQTQRAAGMSPGEAHLQQLTLARKVREALLQSSMLSGVPRVINALVALHEVMPEPLRETKLLRDPKKLPEEHDKRGTELFGAVYRDSAEGVQKLLDTAYPDLGWLCTTIGYGMTYGGTSVLTPVELIYVMVSALIAIDSPRQVAWHLSNARRAGASLAEAAAVRECAVRVAGRAGVVWKAGVPEVGEGDGDKGH